MAGATPGRRPAPPGRRSDDTRGSTPGRASERPQPAQVSRERLEHPHGQQVGRRRGTRRASPDRRGAAPARRPRRGGRRPVAMPPAAEERLRGGTAMHWPLASARPATAPAGSGRTEPVDEGGQHAPGAATGSRGRALEATGDRERDRAHRPEPVARAPRAARGSGRVSASSVTTQSLVAASTPCWSAHALPAQPAWQGRARRRRRLRDRRRAPPCRRSTGRRRRSPRAPPGPREARRDSGPIRAASSRAGITTEIDAAAPSAVRRTPVAGPAPAPPSRGASGPAAVGSAPDEPAERDARARRSAPPAECGRRPPRTERRVTSRPPPPCRRRCGR